MFQSVTQKTSWIEFKVHLIPPLSFPAIRCCRKHSDRFWFFWVEKWKYIKTILNKWAIQFQMMSNGLHWSHIQIYTIHPVIEHYTCQMGLQCGNNRTPSCSHLNPTDVPHVQSSVCCSAPYDEGGIGQVWCDATTGLTRGSPGCQWDNSAYIGSLNTRSASGLSQQ